MKTSLPFFFNFHYPMLLSLAPMKMWPKDVLPVSLSWSLFYYGGVGVPQHQQRRPLAAAIFMVNVSLSSIRVTHNRNLWTTSAGNIPWFGINLPQLHSMKCKHLYVLTLVGLSSLGIISSIPYSRHQQC